MKRILSSIGAALLVAAPALHAEGDIEIGAEKAERCAACHGSDGIGIAPAFPNLANQKAAYLVKQMKDFKSGKRKDPIMELEAKKLSEEDFEHIAAYYESLSGIEEPTARH